MEFVEGVQRRCTGATRTSSRSAATTACTLIYEALKKTDGNTDGEALITAAKGMKWDSPRGPMSIDPETRDVVQTVYIRRVEKVGGELVNVAFDKIENVKIRGRGQGRRSSRSHAACSGVVRVAEARPKGRGSPFPATADDAVAGASDLMRLAGGATGMIASAVRRPVRRLCLRDAAVPAVGRAVGDARA